MGGQSGDERVAMGPDMGIEQRCDPLGWCDRKPPVRSYSDGQTSSDQRLEDTSRGRYIGKTDQCHDQYTCTLEPDVCDRVTDVTGSM